MEKIDELRNKLNKMDRDELINYTIAQQITKEQYLEELTVLRTKKYSTTSEKIDSNQIRLFNEPEAVLDEATTEELDEAAIVPKKKKKKGSKKIDCSKLEVKTIHHDLEDKTCKICGGALKETGTKTVEILKYQPGRYYIEKHIIHNYECRNCGEETIPEDAPIELVEGSVVSAEAVAGIACDKFVLGTPLYRQEQDLKRKQIFITRQNMSNWLIRCSDDYLKYVFERMHKDVQKCDIVHMDETTVVVLEDKPVREKSYEWLLMSGMEEEKQMALYFYNESREYGTLEKLLTIRPDRYIISDGYGAYHNRDYGINVGCMAHVRRYYYEAMEASPCHGEYKKLKTNEKEQFLKDNPSYANILNILAVIQKLFNIDQELKEMAVEERINKKESESLPLLNALFEDVKKLEEQYSQKSKMGKAITYTLDQEEYIRNYLKDGRLEISDNRGERMIKPFVMSRKNFLFSKTKRGAESSSIYFSLIESAIMNNLDPYKYLVYVLERLSKDGLKDSVIEEVLPYSQSLPKNLYTKTK